MSQLDYVCFGELISLPQFCQIDTHPMSRESGDSGSCAVPKDGLTPRATTVARPWRATGELPGIGGPSQASRYFRNMTCLAGKRWNHLESSQLPGQLRARQIGGNAK